jgi:Skp family chaperone for outer membrane proteins
MKNILGVLFCLFLFSKTVAQPKTAFCNLDTILKKLPEVTEIEKTIANYRQKCAERLKNKEKVVNEGLICEIGIYPVYSEEEIAKKEVEKLHLQQELKKDSARYDHEITEKQNELLKPILAKVKSVAEKVAFENGFHNLLYINLLNDNETKDITYQVMQELNKSD